MNSMEKEKYVIFITISLILTKFILPVSSQAEFQYKNINLGKSFGNFI